MAILTGSKTRLDYIAESTYATTPATPAFLPLCTTSVNFGVTRDSLESQCLRPDRQIKAHRSGNEQVGNGFEFELEYGSFDPLLEAAFMGTWNANVLKVGTVFRSFTYERLFTLTTNEYHRYRGCVANSLSLSIQPNAMVTGTLTHVGHSIDKDNLTSQVAGATYGALSTNEPFDSFTGLLEIDDASFAGVTGIELQLENGYEPSFEVFNRYTIQPGDGKSRVTGTLSTYYQSKALYEKFLNETAFKLEFTLQDPLGNTLKFELPNCEFTGGNPDVTDDGPVQLSQEFIALYDDTAQSQIVVTRTPI